MWPTPRSSAGSCVSRGTPSPVTSLRQMLSLSTPVPSGTTPSNESTAGLDSSARYKTTESRTWWWESSAAWRSGSGPGSGGGRNLVDLVVGPDEYRKLPALLDRAFEGEKGIAVRLSRVENYDDIVPLRTDGHLRLDLGDAWMRQVLHVLRGTVHARARTEPSFEERRGGSPGLAARGFRDVTLLGQNVNSYRDERTDFADLMQAAAEVDRSVRIRFTTSHPQDMSDRLIEAIARNTNICKYIHLPVQSGSDRILALMNRTYTVDHYLRLVEKIRTAIPGVSLTHRHHFRLPRGDRGRAPDDGRVDEGSAVTTARTRSSTRPVRTQRPGRCRIQYRKKKKAGGSSRLPSCSTDFPRAQPADDRHHGANPGRGAEQEIPEEYTGRTDANKTV